MLYKSFSFSLVVEFVKSLFPSLLHLQLYIHSLWFSQMYACTFPCIFTLSFFVFFSFFSFFFSFSIKSMFLLFHQRRWAECNKSNAKSATVEFYLARYKYGVFYSIKTLKKIEYVYLAFLKVLYCFSSPIRSFLFLSDTIERH